MSDDNPKEAAIRGLHAYKEQLGAEIEAKKADLRSVERSIQLLSGDPDRASGVQRVFLPPETNGTKYTALKTQAAARLFLGEHGNKWWKSSTIAKELLRRGVRPGKHFKPAVTSSLNRLADKGVAKKEKRGGVFKYKLVARE